MEKWIILVSALFMVYCGSEESENTDSQNIIEPKEFLSSGDQNEYIHEIKIRGIESSNSDDQFTYVPTICNTIRYDDTYAVFVKITERIQDPQNENICELNYYDGPRLLIDAETLAVAYGDEVPKNFQLSAMAEWDWGNSIEKNTEQLMFLNKINNEWFLLYSIVLNPFSEEDSFLSSEETDIPQSFEEYVAKIQEMRANRIGYCNQDYYDKEYFYESMLDPYDEHGECKWK